MTPKIFFYLDNHFDGRKRYIEESLFLMKDKLELKRFKPRKCFLIILNNSYTKIFSI